MSKLNRLFIAEKATVGKRLAEYLAATTGAKLTMNNAYAIVGNDACTWMSGHLLEQVDAHEYDPRYKAWRIDDLPIIPDPFRLVVKRDARSNAQAKVDVIRRMLQDCTTVIGVGDPDPEGQLLQDELLIYLKNRKPVLRLWANALDDTTLAKAFANMRPNEEYIGWYEAAKSRSEADWLYGINMTRACAVHAQNAGADFQITVGRVQTPTLALVVNRELEIRNFKPVDFHVPFIGLMTDPRFRATWLALKDEQGAYEDPRVDAEGRLLNRADADAITAAARAAGAAVVVVAETTAGTEAAPLPFSLSALQTHCSRLYGLSAKQTLDIAQVLYTRKLTSYPRVDCDYLPESQHGEAPRILDSLTKASVPLAFGGALRGANTNIRSRAWNDSKVTAHHAIIPAHLDDPRDIAQLQEIERKVYFEIAKRYVLQFWPVAKVLKTELVLACGREGAEELYSARGKRYTEEGWRKAFSQGGQEGQDGGPDDEAEGASVLPAVKKGDLLRLAEAGVDSKRTQAPKRFTDGTLITAMKTIHQYVKNAEYKKRLRESIGIGTEATRATIIDGLLEKRFLVKEGKELVPTAGAMQLITALPDSMKSPDMTAMWQQFNDQVMARKATHADFIGQLVPWLTTLVRKSATFFTPEQFPGGRRRAAPALTEHLCFGEVGQVGCGSPLKLIEGKYGKFFGCSNDQCKKTFRDVGGKPAEKTERPPEQSSSDPKLACTKCGEGFLRLVARKSGDGHFWGCSNWKGGCKAIYDDADGQPDLEGKGRAGGRSAGQAGVGAGRGYGGGRAGDSAGYGASSAG